MKSVWVGVICLLAGLVIGVLSPVDNVASVKRLMKEYGFATGVQTGPESLRTLVSQIADDIDKPGEAILSGVTPADRHASYRSNRSSIQYAISAGQRGALGQKIEAARQENDRIQSRLPNLDTDFPEFHALTCFEATNKAIIALSEFLVDQRLEDATAADIANLNDTISSQMATVLASSQSGRDAVDKQLREVGRYEPLMEDPDNIQDEIIADTEALLNSYYMTFDIEEAIVALVSAYPDYLVDVLVNRDGLSAADYRLAEHHTFQHLLPEVEDLMSQRASLQSKRQELAARIKRNEW